MIYFILLIMIIIIYQNFNFKITKKEIVDKKLPSNIKELNIIHISDFHDCKFGDKIYEKVKKINPDIIILSGDMIDCRRTNYKRTLELISKLSTICKTFYTSRKS